MENKSFRYSIYKSKVWLELLYKKDKIEVIVNQKCVYRGKNKKDCENWIKERENRKC